MSIFASMYKCNIHMEDSVCVYRVRWFTIFVQQIVFSITNSLGSNK